MSSQEELEKEIKEMNLGEVLDHKHYPNGLISPRAMKKIKNFILYREEKQKQRMKERVETLPNPPYVISEVGGEAKTVVGRYVKLDDVLAILEE